MHLKWSEKFNWRGLGPLVVNIIVSYCCTRVLFIVHKDAKKKLKLKKSIGFFVTFLSLVVFQLEGGPFSPHWLRLWPGPTTEMSPMIKMMTPKPNVSLDSSFFSIFAYNFFTGVQYNSNKQ